MAKTLRFDAATTLTHQDPTGLVPSSATAKFITGDGNDALLTGAVTLPTVATSVGVPQLPSTIAATGPFNFSSSGPAQPLLDPADGATFAFSADGLDIVRDLTRLPEDGAEFGAEFDMNPHVATYHTGDGLAALMTAMAATMAADASYDVTGSNPLVLTGKAPGALSSSMSCATTSAYATIASEHVQVGVDAHDAVAPVVDQWTITAGGSGPPSPGDTFTVAIDEGAGPVDYVATLQLGDDGTLLTADLLAAINADAAYGASAFGGGIGGGGLYVTAKSPGARSTTITTTTSSATATFSSSHSRPGVDEVTGSAGVIDIWHITVAVPDADLGVLGTAGYFAGWWLKAGGQYRKVLTHAAAIVDHVATIALALDTMVAALFAAWQTGIPANSTAISLYEHATVTDGIFPPSGSTRQVLVVRDPAGIVVGDLYRVIDSGVQTIVQATRLSGRSVTISPTLDQVPSDGATFNGLKMAVSVAAPGAANLGTGHRLIWAYTDGATERQHIESLTVAHWIPDPPIIAEQVKALLAAYQASVANSRDGTYYQGIADRVAGKVEQALLATGRRQSCYGDPNAFSEAGRTCARLYLADDGFYPAGAAPEAYLKECQMRLEQELRLAISGLQYDSNGDGAVTGSERQPKFFSFRVSL